MQRRCFLPGPCWRGDRRGCRRRAEGSGSGGGGARVPAARGRLRPGARRADVRAHRRPRASEPQAGGRRGAGESGVSTRTEGRIEVDARTPTEYGTVRTFVRIGGGTATGEARSAAERADASSAGRDETGVRRSRDWTALTAVAALGSRAGGRTAQAQPTRSWGAPSRSSPVTASARWSATRARTMPLPRARVPGRRAGARPAPPAAAVRWTARRACRPGRAASRCGSEFDERAIDQLGAAWRRAPSWLADQLEALLATTGDSR